MRVVSCLTGPVHAFQTFSLFVPDSAHIVATDTGFGGLSLSWPGCDGCRFGVAVQADSGIGLEARVARMVGAQRTIDSINRDPQTVVHEFDDIDGPPQPFVTPTGGDDDVPDLCRQLCEMMVIGKTFVWRP